MNLIMSKFLVVPYEKYHSKPDWYYEISPCSPNKCKNEFYIIWLTPKRKKIAMAVLIVNFLLMSLLAFL